MENLTAGAHTQENGLTTEQLKAIALKQFLNEDFFILTNGENECFIYEGTEEEAREQFEADIEGTEEANIDANFEIFCSKNLIEVEPYDESNYNNDYLVLTDEEADEKAKEYILDTVWAFKPSFLADETGIDVEVFDAIQNNGRCESNNKAILSMIDDEDGFVESAISADGRGHFLSGYDGNENEETVEGEIFYIYRQN